MPGSMTDGGPIFYKEYGIPANSDVQWNEEVHGLPLTEDQIGAGDIVGIGWRPGEYFYVAGACGNHYTFRVPESNDQREPQISILKGIHVFLRELRI